MFTSMNWMSSSNMGHVGSQGQIIGKPCERDRGHVYGPMFMNFYQNVHLYELEINFESGSSWVKVTRLTVERCRAI